MFSKSLLLVYIGIISTLSLMPSEQVSFTANFWDKGLHIFAYSGFSILLFWAFSKWTHRIVGLLLLSGYGIAIECLQGLSPGRDSSINDVLANSAGLFIGAFLFFILQKFIQLFRQ